MATVTYTYDQTISLGVLNEVQTGDQTSPSTFLFFGGAADIYFIDNGSVTRAGINDLGVLQPGQEQDVVTFSSAVSGPLANCDFNGGFALAANNATRLEIVVDSVGWDPQFTLGDGLAQSFGLSQLGSQLLVAYVESDVEGESRLNIGRFDNISSFQVTQNADADAWSDVAVAGLSSGAVIVIASLVEAGNERLTARIVSQDPAVLDLEFDVDAGGSSVDDQAAVLALDGKFVVAWRTDRDGGNTDIVYRVFDNNGVAISGPVTVTGGLAQPAGKPTLTHLGGDDFVIGWEYDIHGDASDLDIHFTVANATGGPASFFGFSVDGTMFGGPGSGLHALPAFEGPDSETNARFITLADGTLVAIAQNEDVNGAGIAYRGLSLTRRTEGADNINDALTGDGLRDTLVGKSGDDTLDGKGGVDTMEGGLGDDKYFLDRATDVVIEEDEGGEDIVFLDFVGDYTLAAFVENARALGGEEVDIIGNDRANQLTGNSSANELYGMGGADQLDGGSDGGNLLVGGTGSDTYIVDRGDVVFEQAEGGGSNDTVFAHEMSYTLGAGLENLVLVAFLNVNGTGNGLDNEIVGGEARNTLTGGRGADILTGGDGDDKFNFDAVKEMGKTQSTRDVITDFTRREDRIDLATIDANGKAAGHKFSFLKTEGAAFTGAKGQLRFDIQDNSGTVNDRTIVLGDVNGDRKADFQIELTGLINLKDADFVL